VEVQLNPAPRRPIGLAYLATRICVGEVRRATNDADANAVRVDATAEHLAQAVRDIAAVDVEDGVVFDLDTISVQEIREQADYPALRVRVAVSIGPWNGVAAWDVSTGDPIVSSPRR
jgi:hypothetical protein